MHILIVSVYPMGDRGPAATEPRQAPSAYKFIVGDSRNTLGGFGGQLD